MSYSVSTLLIRYLRDVFGENAPPVGARPSTSSGPRMVCFTIPAAAPTMVAMRSIGSRVRSKTTHPDFRYQPIAEPEELGDGGRVRWDIGPPW